MTDESRKESRFAGDAWVVDYAIDEEGQETENLTHAASVSDEVIEERGDFESGVVVEIENDSVVFTKLNYRDGDVEREVIGVETARQIAHAFTQAANEIEEQIKAREARKAQIRAAQRPLFGA